MPSNRKHKSFNRAGSFPWPRRSERRLRQRQHLQNNQTRIKQNDTENQKNDLTPTEETSPCKPTCRSRFSNPKQGRRTGQKLPGEQLVMVHAESAVWSDGALGCPEPGMMYTQALVNGYWVVIEAAGQNYDFRVDSRGNFRLCPPGQGHPPSQAARQ
jgi:hypothetical protein